MYMYILDFKEFIKAIEVIEAIYANNMRNKTCIIYSKINLIIFKLTIIFYILITVFVSTYILLRSIFADNKLALSIVLPGNNLNQLGSLVFLTSFHIVLIIVSCVIVGLLDALIVLVFFNTLMFSAMIEQHIDKFQENLKNKRNPEIKIKENLLKIVLILEEFNGYKLDIIN